MRKTDNIDKSSDWLQPSSVFAVQIMYGVAEQQNVHPTSPNFSILVSGNVMASTEHVSMHHHGKLSQHTR
jgi:hypothetical protein